MSMNVQLCIHVTAGSRFIRYSCIYEACMNSTLNGNLAEWRFQHSNGTEIRDRINFDFYTGLPHVYMKLAPTIWGHTKLISCFCSVCGSSFTELSELCNLMYSVCNHSVYTTCTQWLHHPNLHGCLDAQGDQTSSSMMLSDQAIVLFYPTHMHLWLSFFCCCLQRK